MIYKYTAQLEVVRSAAEQKHCAYWTVWYEGSMVDTNVASSPRRARRAIKKAIRTHQKNKDINVKYFWTGRRLVAQ